ncbi:MAG: AAA family ATPase [Candidatus Acidiferrales bacterium]
MYDSFFSFFSLRENPFNVNLDPRYLFPTRQTQEALQGLAYGIQNRQGFILLTGEVGTGKTMVINQLLDWLRRLRAPTAFVFNSNLGASDLFYLMSCDFGIATDPNHRANLLILLHRWLLERYRAGVTPVLIVDEAQGLSFEGLEEIRLLLNFETPRKKLLQIVLAGQPELKDKLNRPEARQLRQRIAVRCKIDPLTLEQTHGYIEQRLRIAGANGGPIFLHQAMDAVYFYARGIPRVINRICEHALINAYVDQLRPVPAHIVEVAAREFQLDEVRPFYPAVTSSPATANQATIQSILERVRTHPAAAHASVRRHRAHAAAAGVSARFPDVSSNNQPAPAFPDPKELSAAPSSSEAPALMNAPFQPTAAFTPRQQRKYWPLKWPASAPALAAQHVSEVVMPPAPIASSPVVPTPEANTRSDAVSASARNQVSAPHEGALGPHEIRSTEEVARRPRWMPILRAQQTLCRWWSVCRDECLSMVTSPARRRMTSSLLQWLRPSMHRVHQRRTNERLQNVHHRPDWVPILLLYRCWSRWRDRRVAIIVQAVRQRMTASFRWLQQPLSPVHRR